MNIQTEYPEILIPVAIIAGLLIAAALYFRDRKNEFGRLPLFVMAALRFLAASTLFFLLLGPMISGNQKIIQKPLLLFFTDNSSSIALRSDSSELRKTQKEIHQLAASFAEEFDTAFFTFGNKVENRSEGTFNEEISDYSQVNTYIKNLYRGRMPSGIILAGDGRFTRGSNPLYAPALHPAKVYTIALGDSSSIRDLVLKKINYNKRVFLNNKFPIEIIVQAEGMKGQEVQLRITEADSLLHEENFIVPSSNYTAGRLVYLKADKKGFRKIKAELIQNGIAEISKQNNASNAYFEVVSEKKKIVLIYDAPHPDVAAVRNALSSDLNYQFTTGNYNQLKDSISGCNLLILHQLPAQGNNPAKLAQSILDQKIPTLYILGEQSDIQSFNQMQSVCQILQSNTTNSFDEAFPFLNESFSLFTLEDGLSKKMENWPPLRVAFGNYQTSGNSQSLVNQKIGRIQTRRPLIAFGTFNDIKTGIIAGEGIWRWRISNYKNNETHQDFDQLIRRMVHYLSLNENKKKLRIDLPDEISENEELTGSAILLNEANEPVNQPDLQINLQDDLSGNSFDFAFSRQGNSYKLRAGQIPVGSYRWTAGTQLGNKKYTETGNINVSSLQLEQLNLKANHRLLQQLALKYKGQMFYPDQMQALQNAIRENIPAQENIRYRKKTEPLTNFWWIAALIVLWLGSEWFLRKRFGSY